MNLCFNLVLKNVVDSENSIVMLASAMKIVQKNKKKQTKTNEENEKMYFLKCRCYMTSKQDFPQYLNSTLFNYCFKLQARTLGARCVMRDA